MSASLRFDAELDAARERYRRRCHGSLAAHRAATDWLPGGNTRTVLYHGPFPLRLAGGDGARVTDVDGHRYLNLLGEYSAGLFGHSHPVIRRAIDRALDGGVNLGGHNTLESELARHVVARFAAIERVRFTNSGTEANLMAIGTARVATARSKVMVFRGGYHGGLLYFGASGSPVNAPYDFIVAPYNDLAATARLIDDNGADLACVLVEPMQGSGGCIPADPAFLHGLREATTKVGALLVFDEVMTSRFGRGGAHAALGIRPDLMTLGKWVGGGMSFGAFGGRADLMARYDPTRADALPHAGTFNNNVLSMSAGVAALTEVFGPDVAEAHHQRGEALRHRIDDGLRSAGVDVGVSGQGSLMNLHPTRTTIRSVDDLASCDPRRRELLYLDLLERGFYVAPRGFIALTLAVSPAEESGFVQALAEIARSRAELLASPQPARV